MIAMAYNLRQSLGMCVVQSLLSNHRLVPEYHTHPLSNTRAAAALSLWRAAAAAEGRGGVATLAAAVSSSNRGAALATAARLLTDWQPLHHKKCHLISVHRTYGEFVGASIRKLSLLPTQQRWTSRLQIKTYPTSITSTSPFLTFHRSGGDTATMLL